MDMETLLTKEKADAICEKIVRGLEENKIVGSANVIAYAMKESWLPGALFWPSSRKTLPNEDSVPR
jgi:hypothetical protein